MFRTLILGVSAVSILAMPIAATAQNGDRDDRDRQYQGDDRRDGRGDDRRDDDRRGDDRRDSGYRDNGDRRDRDRGRDDRGDWRSYRNYDYNRLPRGERAYYADQYYRDGRYYQPRRLGPNDRIYRGRDNRYYCRRSDGTTGLIVGAIGGGVLGNVIASGGSNTLGTVLGAVGGGLLGRSVDRNNVTCR